jgi:hypothetical protein
VGAPLKERLAVFKRAHTLFIDNAQTTTDLIRPSPARTAGWRSRRPATR